MTFISPFHTNANFDRVAWCYDVLAKCVFGKAQLSAPAHFLHLIPDFSRVLLIGGGSGWLLEQLLLQKPNVQVSYLEASSKMILLAEKRTAHLKTESIEWRCGTEQSLRESDRFDVLLTPFVLDLFTQQQLLQQFLPAVLAHVDPNGMWLFTDFVYPRNWWQRLFEKCMYGFFRCFIPLPAIHFPDFNAGFDLFRFQRRQSQFFYSGFIEASVLTKKVQN